jgi:hypothetical protein
VYCGLPPIQKLSENFLPKFCQNFAIRILPKFCHNLFHFFAKKMAKF